MHRLASGARSVAVADPDSEFSDLLVDLAALFHQTGDLVVCVDDGRVVTATEFPGDRGVRKVCERSEQVHPDLTGDHERPAPARAAQFLDA